MEVLGKQVSFNVVNAETKAKSQTEVGIQTADQSVKWNIMEVNISGEGAPLFQGYETNPAQCKETKWPCQLNENGNKMI